MLLEGSKALFFPSFRRAVCSFVGAGYSRLGFLGMRAICIDIVAQYRSASNELCFHNIGANPCQL